jgi:hypothetical protein
MEDSKDDARSLRASNVIGTVLIGGDLGWVGGLAYVNSFNSRVNNTQGMPRESEVDV